MRTTTWVMKLSKFCNLRCKYCYEWNELGDRRRMSLDLWERTLAAVVEHDTIARGRLDREGRGAAPHRNLVVLHGGEPLALPTAYLAEILAIYRRVTRSAAGNYRLSVQSNLFSIQQEKIDLLKEHEAHIAVSFDLVPGVRLNLAGQPTEGMVSRNIDLLREQGLALGAIAVLGAHTARHVERIYDFFAERQMAMRILPLFDGPSERETGLFAIDHASQRRALEALFRHWLETGCRVRLDPLMGYFQAALRHMAGVVQPVWKRELHGDSTFIVNTDGELFRPLDAYEHDLALGSLSRDSISSILESEDYARSLDRDREEFAGHCAKCAYLGACNGASLYAMRVTSPYEGLCPSAHACISFMIAYLEERGYGAPEIRHLLEGIRAASSATTSLEI
jgi:uncharacterized protein